MKHTNKGFTLLETIVALAVMTLIVSGGFLFILQIIRAQNFNIEQSESITQAQNGIKTMVAEAREAAPADDGAYPLEVAEENKLTFYSDVDTDADREKITYEHVGNTITRTTIESVNLIYDPLNAVTETLVEDVVNTDGVFTYFNGDWPIDMVNNPLTSPVNASEVRLIHVNLEINARPIGKFNNFTVDSDIHLRNLKTNESE